MRTWVELNAQAARKNYNVFRSFIAPRVKLWAVVKSNAYGHGLFAWSSLLQGFGIDGFCVDSLVEALALRRVGIKKPLLVLGHTLPALLGEAREANVTVSVSNFNALQELARLKHPPLFHVKVDTGMHRQGFYIEEIPKVIRAVQKARPELRGLFTHFASAKDINYPTYTEEQFRKFRKAIKMFEASGFRSLIKHCAATGGMMIDKRYHEDAVRVGIGMYGLYPSKELETQSLFAPGKRYALSPVLSWHALIGEIKNLKVGDYVGYDLTERVTRPTKMAILPIGYWHGFPRSLSGIGFALVNGRRAKVLGRVSMDLIVLDVTGIGCRIGDRATLIGRDRGAEITAEGIAAQSGTTHYEFLTRLNPLMERIVV